MTENDDLSSIPQAAARPKNKIRISAVWIIPVLAALVGLGITIQKIINEGPTISIVFQKAEGIEAGKTFVKYKDVKIGQVQTVKLSRDFTKVVVTAKIDKSAAGLIVEDAKFWIESPRVSLSGVSGLGTVLSGNHIGLEVGNSTRMRHEFTGLELPPPITVDQQGRQFVLQADTLGSVGFGTPVYYRQINVGMVIGYDLTGDGKGIDIRIFVNAPYDKYVTTHTRFWHASGIDMEMKADGLTLKTESALSILIGGIAFDQTPSRLSEAKPAVQGSNFKLFNNKTTAMAEHEDIVVHFVLYFNESLRGLSTGAPVTFAGLPVGEITDVGLEFNEETQNIRPRVDIAIYPAHFLEHIKRSQTAHQKVKNGKWRATFLQQMIDRGLRAQIHSGNLLTGQFYIALKHFPNATKARKIDWNKPPYEFPVMASSLEDIETKLNSIIGKIDKIPFDVIGQDLSKTITTLNQTLHDADAILKGIDKEIKPEIKTTLQELQKTLTTAERAIGSAESTLIGKDAPAQHELRTALQEISRAARSISELVEYLEQNPDSLLRGKNKEEPQ